jgi:hypothetical protein
METTARVEDVKNKEQLIDPEFVTAFMKACLRFLLSAGVCVRVLLSTRAPLTSLLHR